jgi:DNA-binding sugar fermentation-stimulating protein
LLLFTPQLAEDLRSPGVTTLVGAHPLLAERLVEAAVQQGLLEGALGRHTALRRQQVFGDARVDFVLQQEAGVSVEQEQQPQQGEAGPSVKQEQQRQEQEANKEEQEEEQQQQTAKRRKKQGKQEGQQRPEQQLLLEVKNVVCADFPAGGVPESRVKVGGGLLVQLGCSGSGCPLVQLGPA